ncbi:MAG: 2,3-bisphosphoglycerate-independent phosphoglycerate mutase, partial [Alphaproteobacteria bacterium]
TEIAYDAIVAGKGGRASDALAAIEGAYGAGITDEFVAPALLGNYGGAKDGDGILVANFRADRVRQLAQALLDPGFDGFGRKRTVKFAAAAGLAQYSTALDHFMATLFPRQSLDDVLGQVVAGAGLTQLRIAETEKYAHVTFFFNGGEELEFEGEHRILVPSPKVATYDETPAMSAEPVTDKLVAAIAGGKFDFILVNYANTDMVGHTGDLGAAIKAVETVDRCLGRLRAATAKAGGTLVITADHGNAELMRDRDKAQPHTAHTTNPVPLVLVNGPAEFAAVEDGRLCDIAPTVLELLRLGKPAAMTGHSLLVKVAEHSKGAEQHASA